MLQRIFLNPTQIIDAGKNPIVGEEAWTLLANSEEIQIAKGKQYRSVMPQIEGKEAILAQVLGRSGKLRAPTLRIGKRFLVGFSESLYEQFAG